MRSAVIVIVSLLSVTSVCFADGQASGTIAVTVTVEPSCRVAVEEAEPPSLVCSSQTHNRPQPRIVITPPVHLPSSETSRVTTSIDGVTTINF